MTVLNRSCRAARQLPRRPVIVVAPEGQAGDSATARRADADPS